MALTQQTNTHTQTHLSEHTSLPLLDNCLVQQHQEEASSRDGHNAITTRRNMSAHSSSFTQSEDGDAQVSRVMLGTLQYSLEHGEHSAPC